MYDRSRPMSVPGLKADLVGVPRHVVKGPQPAVSSCSNSGQELHVLMPRSRTDDTNDRHRRPPRGFAAPLDDPKIAHVGKPI